MNRLNRRRFMVTAAGACASAWTARSAFAQNADPVQAYGAIEGEPFPVPAINLARIRPQFLRAYVGFDSDEQAGTIVIDPASHYLYLTEGNGRAMRYGVGVGRQGFVWSGAANIKAKREWPDWYPPKEMIARDPHIMSNMSNLQSGIGMHGGPGNPLGARAMYLYQGNKDTLFRIHGTVEPWTIGSSISSGCIRMINQDVMDLYQRVPLGTKVVVLAGGAQRVRPDPELDMESAPQPAYRQPDAQQPDQAPAYDPYDPYGFDRMQPDPDQ